MSIFTFVGNISQPQNFCKLFSFFFQIYYLIDLALQDIDSFLLCISRHRYIINRDNEQIRQIPQLQPSRKTARWGKFKRTLRIFCPVEFDLHTSHSPGHTQPIEKATRSTRTHKSNPPNSLSPISRKLKLQIAQLFFQVLRAVMKKRGGSSRGRLDEVSTRSKDSSTFFSFSLAQRKICFCHPPLPPATDSHGLRFTDRIEQLPTLYLFLFGVRERQESERTAIICSVCGRGKRPTPVDTNRIGQASPSSFRPTVLVLNEAERAQARQPTGGAI